MLLDAEPSLQPPPHKHLYSNEFFKLAQIAKVIIVLRILGQCIGSVIGYFGSSMDLTATVELEQSFTNSNAFMGLTFYSLPSFFLIPEDVRDLTQVLMHARPALYSDTLCQAFLLSLSTTY